MADNGPELSWQEFRALAEAGGLTAGIVETHIGIDEANTEGFDPRLVFSPQLAKTPSSGVASEEIVATLELDDAIKGGTFVTTSARGIGNRLKIAVEGDSWFHLPPFIYPTDIVDVLRRMFDVNSTAKWADTLEEMVSEKQYLQVLGGGQRRHFLVSAGGNDVVGSIGSYVDRFRTGDDDAQDASSYIKSSFRPRVKELIALFRTMADEIAQLDVPPVTMYVHGYANVIPIPKGPYVGLRLEQLGFDPARHPDLTAAIVEELVEIFNEELAAFARASGGRVIYIDLRDEMGPGDWHKDELHPNGNAATRLAAVFAKRIRRGDIPALS
ncbi:SGNH/GDSL hydrolase family protein [Rhizobium sp. Leaf383]|uniref:SGNH/GDSL hydrolase family protein n=1 Tax=Rhizobium sp. Leaf383 TaxID=1736357 RepID=UPI000714AB2E|nr:SGNH/GDSL hydrolase family protein [Rhizobium sp. Leaf383]KQS75962.1 hypothetical protein ASG58_14140 [Rhizobium sp. Leaf383]